MIDEIFAIRVSEVANNLTGLMEIKDYLDESKRAIRDTIHKENRTAPYDGQEYKKDDLHQRLEELLVKSSYVAEKVRVFKAEQKILNTAVHRKANFTEAFMAAAELVLNEEMFLEVEAKAQYLMEQKET